MALCREYRIPYSQFRGLGDGTWSAGDRDKALAYADYLRGMCPQCGTRESEWVDENGEYVDSYIAVTHNCFGCEEIAMRQKEIPDGQAGGGLKVLLLPAHIHAAQQLAAELGAR
jgi:hypothetical protein